MLMASPRRGARFKSAVWLSTVGSVTSPSASAACVVVQWGEQQ